MTVLAGVAKLADGSPASEVIALRRSTNTLLKLIPDSQGNFSVMNVGVGEWLVSALGPAGYRPQSHLVSVETDPDLHWDDVISLLHFDGADGGTTITDQKGVVWTRNGNAQIDTEQSKFGGSSLVLDGTGDYLQTSGGSNWNFTAGDFTLEGFLRTRVNNSQRTIISKRDTGANQNEWGFYLDGSGRLSMWIFGSDDSNTACTGTTTLSLNTWYHFAFVRSGSTLMVFLDGVLEKSAIITAPARSSTYNVRIGKDATALDTRDWNGWLEDLRITNGFARYTENFNPPMDPFPDFGP